MSRNYTAELHALFNRERVLDLSTIGHYFPARSRISLVRDLKKVEAITSYNHCGKYYTLRELASFNSQGIWQCKDALFSTYGNLKHTIKHMVDNSNDGMTHEELKAILSLRVHDVLRIMVRDNLIAREEVHNIYLYISSDPEVGRRQAVSRTIPSTRRNATQSDPMFVIEVLSYAIQHPKATAADAYRHFEKTGVSQCEVEALYERHVHGKKN